ncbi:MAG: glutamine--fructose-6-phosphate transaminase (isomerizing) [Lachnospiraceae bacterium]|nr:glutamine--fructose-6-phosphate transaminase (isomerizing) [Lachnospiraceae bacterium]
MCGIIGFIGQNAQKTILNGLELLEYRGYDSAGLAMRTQKMKNTEIFKCKGRVRDLRNIVPEEDNASGCGIGHTRWATHGGVCDQNAHPHKSGKVTLVHNGIIENYADLTEEYELEDVLVSETDTEVVAALLDKYYDGDPQKTIWHVAKKLRGTYALVIMFEDIPDRIFAIRNVSPIVVTTKDDNAILASDPAALYQFSKSYFVLPEESILCMEQGTIRMTDQAGNLIEPEYQTVDWEVESVGKKGYPFFMEKEIMEQPEAIKRILEHYIKNDEISFAEEKIPDEVLYSFDHICIVACGTALHAGMIGQTLLKRWANMRVDVEMASEFMYSDTRVDEHTLFIAVSQSGETIDTMGALKKAKECGATCLAILNVRGSSISREADYVLYTDAGPEIAVASTKAYTTQLLIFYLFALKAATLKGLMGKEEFKEALGELKKLPNAMTKILEMKNEIHLLSKEVVTAPDLFMIGRGLDYLVLLEGALKLKEISYIHTEAYAAGELKHGTIALITEGTPVIAAVTQKPLLAKSLSNVKEIKARGANVVLLTRSGLTKEIEGGYHVIELPDLSDAFMPFLEIEALQLYAYFVSSDKGLDVDKPRNLAKVVTVE